MIYLEKKHRSIDARLKQLVEDIPDKTGNEILATLREKPRPYIETQRVRGIKSLFTLLRKEAKGKLINPLVVAYEIGIIKSYLQDLDVNLVTMTPATRMWKFEEYKQLVTLIKKFEKEMIKAHKLLRESGRLKVDLIRRTGIVSTGMASIEYVHVDKQKKRRGK